MANGRDKGGDIGGPSEHKAHQDQDAIHFVVALGNYEGSLSCLAI